MQLFFRLVSLPLLCALAASPGAQESLVGHWEGAVDSGGASIRMILHLAADGEGLLGGTVDSPEQNAFGLEVAELSLAADTLALRVPDSQGAWEGRVEGKRLVGTWKQRGAELALDFERVQVDPLVGTWEGTCDFGSLSLRLRFHVGTRSDRSLGANLVSPDQSPAHIPIASVEMDPSGTVRFAAPTIGASYEGQPNLEATRIEGHFSQGVGRFVLNLEKIGAPRAKKRPQTPQAPFPYQAEEVAFDNPAAQSRLAGTLTQPKEGGPFPAVILITGSGQQDRNEEIFGHKPFLVWADHLTRAGVAVLRLDDRGVGGSTGDVGGATSADFASDITAAIEWLRKREDIRPDRIGLMGHSEGGLIAPMVATERNDVAFLVLLAGPGIPGDQILLLQGALLARASGTPESAIQANRAQQEALFAILREEDDPVQSRERLHEVLSQGGQAALASLDQVASPWFRFFVRHDPAPVLRRVTCPVLAVNGGLDLQVPPKENLAAISAALKAGGNTDHEAKEYPGLNHLFQHATKGSVTEYGEIEETIAPEVLADVTAWILERTR